MSDRPTRAFVDSIDPIVLGILPVGIIAFAAQTRRPTLQLGLWAAIHDEALFLTEKDFLPTKHFLDFLI